MEASMVLRTLDKVDQAVARLQELQTSIASTRMNLETDRNSDGQKSCRQSTSPRFDCHDFLGGYKRLVQCRENSCMKESKVPTVSSGAARWKQWSAPAEAVHQTMSEILQASRFSNEMAALLADNSFEQLKGEEEHQRKLKADAENSILSRLKTVMPLQGPAGKMPISNGIISTLKNEDAEPSTHGTNSFQTKIPLAPCLVDGSHSSLPNESPNMSLETTKVKSTQKVCKAPYRKAVMPANHSFASNNKLLPSSPTSLRTSTSWKHVDTLPFANKSKLAGLKPPISRVSSQQRPPSAGKLQQSPVKSVSIKGEVMKRKTHGTCQALASSSAGSRLTKQPQNFREIPDYSNPEAKNPLKYPSHHFHVHGDTRDHARKNHGFGLSDRCCTNQERSSLRASKTKAVDRQVMKTKQTSRFPPKLKAFEFVRDKENLQLAGCTPAALCLKGSCFAGNERVLHSEKARFW